MNMDMGLFDLGCERGTRDQTQGHTHAKDVLDHGATKEWFPTDLLGN